MAERDPYDLIQELASNDQIKDVLRKYKLLADDPTIKKELLVGGNQAELIGRLKKAVINKHIPLIEVTNLIRETEENGCQHILYYRPCTVIAKKFCNDGTEVASKLFGNKWESKMNFPRYFENPEDFAWADFRIGLPNKETDWVAKLYHREKTFSLTDEVTKADGTLVKTFTPRYDRVVILARWNAPDLLEVRVSRCESRATFQLRLNALWTRLRLAFEKEKDFIEWGVSKIRKKMLEERRANETIYTTGSLQITDSRSNKAAFHPSTPDECADDAEESSEAIDALLRNRSSTCDHLITTYLQSGSASVLEKDLRILIGSRYDHEIFVSTQASCQALDYVTNHLRSFE